MKIFEFHFNPKGNEDLIFDSFCYEPENVFEKRLGSLFVMGDIKNVLPQSQKFLDKLAAFFKKEYYSSPLKSSPESALKWSLKKANEFLENIAKSGDVTWLGNLNLSVFSVKDFKLNLAKTGPIKILLLRQGDISDVGKNLELEEIEPYPLKIFGKIVSGKLAEDDLILVLSKDVFNFFSTPQKSGTGKAKKISKSLLRQIAEIQPFDEKKLRALLKSQERELIKISGICLVLFFTKEVWLETARQQSFTFQKEPEKFSFKKLLSPALNLFKKRKLNLPYVFSKLNATLYSALRVKLRLPRLKPRSGKAKKLGLSKWISLPKINRHFKKPKIRIPSIKKLRLSFKYPAIFKKNTVLFSCLVAFLLTGFLIFQKQEHDQLKRYRAALDSAQQNISQAENYLTLNNEQKAYEIYKTALEQVLPVAKEKSSLQDEAVSLQNSIQDSLEKISKLDKIQDPKLLYEFDEKEFIPQKMIFSGNYLYFFSQLSKDVSRVNLFGQKDILPIDQTFNDAAAFGSQVLFFQKPNLIYLLKPDVWNGPLPVNLPYADFAAKDLATYRNSLYFLDDKAGQIIKYAAPISQNYDLPQSWLTKSTARIIDAKSITIDGPVWILNEDDTISQYYTGSLRKKMTLDLFPEPQNLYSITAAYGLLYILEPAQKRIIVITETGSVQKQWQSDKFDNLKELAVSSDGRTVWLLNGTKVFEVSF